MKIQFKSLKHWMGAYLHQDFDIVHGTVDQALADFIQDGINDGDSMNQGLKEELDYLINNPIDDWDDLFYNQFGSNYYYPSEWPSALDWLRHLRDETDRLLSEKNQA